jgi:hypothetical protein
VSDERLTAAQQRARTLLAPLREQRAPHGDELVARLRRTARWQRPVRRAVLAVGHAAAALGEGLAFLGRRR